MTPLQTFLSKDNTLAEISFTDADHRYFDPTKPDLKYTSATTFISEFEPIFDTELWAMQTALKEKGYKCRVDVDNRLIFVNGIRHTLANLERNTLFNAWHKSVLARWRVMTEEACERGNQNHDYLEGTINQSKGFTGRQDNDNAYITPSTIKGTIDSINDLDKTNLISVYPSIYNRLAAYVNKGCTIFAEKRVRLDMVQLAGMIDVPIFKNGTLKFSILDWKTNKDELKDKPGYYKKDWVGGALVKTDEFIVTDKCFKGVLSHLPYCKMNVYSLQLSLYAYILECWGYVLADNGLEIMHIRPNLPPKLIKVPYLKKEIELMMMHRLGCLGIPLPMSIDAPKPITFDKPATTFKRGIK